jgi:acyl CoA:acetate/3-ketoacid CoA transferase
MNKLPRITEIIKIEPFKVTCRWTTGEVRVIDFEILFEEWKPNNLQLEGQLVDFQVFKFVSVSEEKNLQWVNLPYQHAFWDEHGNQTSTFSPFAIDPDLLYARSQPLENYRLVPLGIAV